LLMNDSPPTSHFSPAELSCRCGCGRNNVKPQLIELLEHARSIFGKPLVLTSASRCPARELQVSGKYGGAHVDGDAADIFCDSDLDRFRLARIFFELGINRIGVASNFIHVDISDHLPQAVFWTYPS
jgi:zinc D-Ala-D-Ala carboxypeptidase